MDAKNVMDTTSGTPADAVAEDKQRSARKRLTERFPGVDFDGWTVEVSFRKSVPGFDTYYFPPGSTRKLRSLNEVHKFLFPAADAAECSTMVLDNEDEEPEDDDDFIVPVGPVGQDIINLVRDLGKDIAKRHQDGCAEFWTELEYKSFIVYYRGDLQTFEFRGHKFRVYTRENSLYMKEVENNGWDWRLPLDTLSDGSSVRIKTHEKQVVYAMEEGELPLKITEHDLLVAFAYIDQEGRELEWHVTATIKYVVDDGPVDDRPVDEPLLTLTLGCFYTFANSAEEEMAEAAAEAAEGNMAEDDDDNDSVCEHCGDGGDLLICDGCDNYYHRGCVGLSDDFSDDPKEKWLCPWCLEEDDDTAGHKGQLIDLTVDTP
jgi:hypothetical protein